MRAFPAVLLATVAALTMPATDGAPATRHLPETVSPESPLHSQSGSFQAPSPTVLRGKGVTVVEPNQRQPVVKVEDFGARGDGVSDDSEAINRAIHSLGHGGTVLFAAGKIYAKRDLVHVDVPGVALWGYGATLYSLVTDGQVRTKGAAHIAVHLEAPQTAVYGLTIISNVRARGIGHPNLSGITLLSRRQTVMDCRLEYVGLFAMTADDFLIARNVVYRSTADGIHVTDGSHDGRILGNVIRQSGDDAIGVVNYGTGEPNISGIVIAGNDVADQYWGRGISVVGGRDVVVRDNSIARVPFAAGILINSETSYHTANVRHVEIRHNELNDIQTMPPAYSPAGRWEDTGHGAIDINGQGDQQVSDVLVSDNRVDGARRDGIFVRGHSCGLDIRDNSFRKIGRLAIHVALREAMPQGCAITCRHNTAADGQVVDGQCPAPPAGPVSP